MAGQHSNNKEDFKYFGHANSNPKDVGIIKDEGAELPFSGLLLCLNWCGRKLESTGTTMDA
jgi:hypothetical protein